MFFWLEGTVLPQECKTHIDMSNLYFVSAITDFCIPHLNVNELDSFSFFIKHTEPVGESQPRLLLRNGLSEAFTRILIKLKAHCKSV